MKKIIKNINISIEIDRGRNGRIAIAINDNNKSALKEESWRFIMATSAYTHPVDIKTRRVGFHIKGQPLVYMGLKESIREAVKQLINLT